MGEEEEESRRSTRKEMEEKAREDEKDVEVMAVVAVEVNERGRGAEGGSFYKKSGRERGPFRRRDRR